MTKNGNYPTNTVLAEDVEGIIRRIVLIDEKASAVEVLAKDAMGADMWVPVAVGRSDAVADQSGRENPAARAVDALCRVVVGLCNDALPAAWPKSDRRSAASVKN